MALQQLAQQILDELKRLAKLNVGQIKIESYGGKED